MKYHETEFVKCGFLFCVRFIQSVFMSYFDLRFFFNSKQIIIGAIF